MKAVRWIAGRALCALDHHDPDFDRCWPAFCRRCKRSNTAR